MRPSENWCTRLQHCTKKLIGASRRV